MSQLNSFSSFTPITQPTFDDEILLKNHDQLFPYITENNQLQSNINHMLSCSNNHTLSTQFNQSNALNKVLIIDDKIETLLAKSYKSNDCSTCNSDAGSIFTKDFDDLEPKIKKQPKWMDFLGFTDDEP